MLASLGLASLTLRAGLRLRSARRRGARLPGNDYRRHLKLAKPTLAMLLVGFAGGPLSAVWLRGFEPFHTAHAAAGLLALALFVATGIQGWRLEHGRSRAAEPHGILALFSVLAAATAFATGFVLLP